MASKSRTAFKVPSRHGFSGYRLYRRSGHRRMQMVTIRRNAVVKGDETLRTRSSTLSEELNKKYLKLVADWKRSLIEEPHLNRTPESFGICLPEPREPYCSDDESPPSTPDQHELYLNSADPHKLFPSVPVIVWSSLFSSAAQEHAKAGLLEPLQQEMVEVAKAVDAMGDITNVELNDCAHQQRLESNISVAQYLSNVEDRELDGPEVYVISSRNFWFSTLQVKVGKLFMHVDRYVFFHYLKGFEDYKSWSLEFPANKVSMILLAHMYNWMVSESPALILGHDFVEMYHMAKYLNVRYLLELYWHSLSIHNGGEGGVWEQEAFRAYQICHRLGCSDLMAIFMNRIQKLFLPLVASEEFLAMEAGEVAYLLKMDSLCVNSEDEVFFAAVYWLGHNWEERQQYMEQVMASVRYCMISPWLHRSILHKPENEIIRKVGESHTIRALLWRGLCASHAMFAKRKDPELADDPLIMRIMLIKDFDRKWGFCPGIPHHHAPDCCRFSKLSFKMFLKFLNFLHDDAKKYMAETQFVPYKYFVPLNCCSKKDFVRKVTLARQFRKRLAKQFPFEFRYNVK
ncbi:uncharacterized protein LOC6577778 [Drosophila mojavensis]|uniref:uncharacterized protein LOC6577778 n=1 Tax=Drosophila mojavensis TaxID=7230 RepID=UPI001CD14B1A|nr:uncharacterized protein LOC6577778 [Drosophila mojavensis]